MECPSTGLTWWFGKEKLGRVGIAIVGDKAVRRKVKDLLGERERWFRDRMRMCG